MLLKKIPLTSSYKHNIILSYSGSSLNTNSANITGAYTEAYQRSICVGWAGGQPMGLWLHVTSSWTTVPLPPHTPNEVIAGLGL